MRSPAVHRAPRSAARASPPALRCAAVITALLAAEFVAPAFAQVPTPSASPPATVAIAPLEPILASDARSVLDQIAGCTDTGTLRLEIDLREGRVPVADAWAVEVVGSPKAEVVATAVAGHVSRLDLTVAGGRLLVRGAHLRPKVFVTRLRFEEGKGITDATFRGRGIWRPVVWLFRGLARSALRKLELRTDVPSVMRGEVLGAKGASTPAPSGAARPPGPSFLDLVSEVRIHDSEITAYGGRPLSFSDLVELHTAAQPRDGSPVRLAITKGLYRPPRDGQPAQLEVVGRVDGEIEDGAVALLGSRSTFSHGELRGGTFRLATDSGGALEATLAADSLAADLTGGELDIPGGPRVDVEAPSHLVVRDLQLQPDGRYSGIVDAQLLGKAGRIERDGVVVSLSDVKLHAGAVTVVNGRATGAVELAAEYRMDYPLVVRYPVAEIGKRSVPLLFQGSFTTTLHLEEAGPGGEGTVTGDYRFTVPWPPVEQAAFEVLRAAWSQDVTPVMRDVEFRVEPQRFGPCGGSCFLVDLDVTVEKQEPDGRLFRQLCEAQGKADIVVDVASRSFVLQNVRIEPRCRGVAGWVVNVIGPLLTRTYADITLFQMPRDLPFTVETVDSGTDWIAVAGKVAWTSDAPDAPSGPAQHPASQASASTP